MSKLLTAGCSFTFYKWLTWADYLSNNFDRYINKGIPGADNATIARIITAMAEPGDTVVVMWTSYQRHNFNIGYSDTYNYSSNHCGGSHAIKNKHYMADIFNPYERFLTTLDYIQWAVEDSQLRQYALYQFSAFPFITGELQLPVTKDIASLIEEKQFIVDNIVCPSLEEFAKDDVKELEDSHPTSESHYRFYKKVVCPTLQIQPIISKSQDRRDV
jgi:hypothetical protein